jgi:glycosyltransferase involved in cell wall biosynthesis
MRLTFIADLRSPIALQWIRHFVEQGHAVQAISSYPVSGDVLPGATTTTLPLVLPGLGRAGAGGPSRPDGEPGRPAGGPGWPSGGRGRPAGERRHPARARAAQLATPGRVAAVRSVLGPALARSKRGRLQELVERHQPDLIHAMRIPFEGIAAAALTGRPVIVSVWGNDFTLFAGRTRMMARATRRALAAAEVLHCDCDRDARMAGQWGFPATRPIWVLPGNGGVNRSVFRQGPSDFRARLGVPERAPLILNPRGIREYVRNDTFFTALSPVLRTFPDVHVVCPGMAGSRSTENMIAAARLDRGRVHLLPTLDHRLMADAFRASRVSVSLAEHDGTPNSLLEAMACGALPVVAGIASVREWIQDGINGLVVPAADPAAVATALGQALQDDALGHAARTENERLIRERADYHMNMLDVESRYEALAKAHPARAEASVAPCGSLRVARKDR